MKIYHVETKEDYDALMVELEKKGSSWISEENPTDLEIWDKHKENTCVRLDKNSILYTGIDFYEEFYPEVPIETYKASSQSPSSDEDTVNNPKHCDAFKDNIKDDLKKAQHYLQRVIDKLEE